MPLAKRNELPAILNAIGQGKMQQIYLFFGERYLCKEAADSLQKALLQNNAGAVHPIDGDQEDAGRTLNKLLSFSLLPGLQIYRVTDSRLFQSKNMGSDFWDKAAGEFEAKRPAAALRYLLNMLSLAGIPFEEFDSFSELGRDQWKTLFATEKPQGNLDWADKLLLEAGPRTLPKSASESLVDRYREAFIRGLPTQNILILTAENVDKRKRLFTIIKESGLAIDCTVDAGAGTAAQKVQKEVLLELMQKTLDGFGKKIEPKSVDMFLERVGFHPVAVVMECEKLALYVENRPLITRLDLETMVGRSREDALFELTDAFGKRQIAGTLIVLHHLLEDGFHSLAILATMRNYIRRLLIFRSLQLRSTPRWQQGMSPQQFQGNYLPVLKKMEEWPDLLKGHPYALYMNFTKAAEFSCSTLKKWLELLLQAEFRLKGSPLPQHIILNELMLTMLSTRSTR